MLFGFGMAFAQAASSPIHAGVVEQDRRAVRREDGGHRVPAAEGRLLSVSVVMVCRSCREHETARNGNAPSARSTALRLMFAFEDIGGAVERLSRIVP